MRFIAAGRADKAPTTVQPRTLQEYMGVRGFDSG